MSEPSWFALYSRTPIWMQNLVCSAAGVQMKRTRYNRCFRDALEFLEASQWKSLAEQEAYQQEQLARVIRHAYDTVPYYRGVFDRAHLTPDDIRTADDLQKLPLLTKDTIRRRFQDLQSTGWPEKRRVRGHTGGTTGTALPLMADIDTQPWQWAVWWRHHRRFGLNVRDPFVGFAGRSVVPLSRMHPPIWRRNLPMHQTYVSVHHMTRENMPALVDYLQRRRVAYYFGYPSALYLLSIYLLERDIRLAHPPRITATGAESILPHQRRVLERALDTEVADQYGASEQCGNISECEQHRYHVDTEFGIVEFLPIEGLPAEQRRIVCTGFRNPVMPLIRYDIEDVATLSPWAAPCPCGRQSPTVVAIDGRIESYIVTPDGRQAGRLDFLFKDTSDIVEVQLIQEALDQLTVKVVRTPAYTHADEQNLLKDIRHYLGQEIRVVLEYVNEIPREGNGKFRQIVSRVWRDRYADQKVDGTWY